MAGVKRGFKGFPTLGDSLAASERLSKTIYIGPPELGLRVNNIIFKSNQIYLFQQNCNKSNC